MGYFEAKAKFRKEIGEGKVKEVTETYLLEAEDFTEAEEMISVEMIGEEAYTTEAVRKVEFAELIIDGKSQRYYKVKMMFTDEKISTQNVLIKANDIREVREEVQKLANVLYSCEITAISEASYMDYIENPSTKINRL